MLTDVGHEAAAAAVVKEAIDRVRQVLAVTEVAEGVGELGPVPHEDRLVDRSLAAGAEEPAGAGPHGLDGLRPAVHLFYVNTRTQIRSCHML